MPGGQDGPPGRVGAGVRGEEEGGHGGGGEDEPGGGGLPRRTHQGQGALDCQGQLVWKVCCCSFCIVKLCGFVLSSIGRSSKNIKK